ncbi:hypothetical protein EMIT0373P_10797 [Pseudomonas chlororaphis]
MYQSKPQLYVHITSLKLVNTAGTHDHIASPTRLPHYQPNPLIPLG